MKKFFRDESGQTLALVALAMAVIMGFAALAVDVGLMANSRSRLQNAADAAALAGAMEIPPIKKTGEVAAPILSNVETAAKAYATKNGYTGNVTVVTNLVERSVRVSITENVEHFFARVFIRDSSDMHANAKAQRYAVLGSGALPLINYNTDVAKGGDIEIRIKEKDGEAMRQWIYIEKEDESNKANAGYDPTQLIINPFDGLYISPGNQQSYANHVLNPLLDYAGPYYIYSINPVILNADEVWIGVYHQGKLSDPQSKIFPSNDFKNGDNVAPFAKLVGGKYYPTDASDPDRIEQIVLLEVSGFGPIKGGDSLAGTVEEIYSLYDTNNPIYDIETNVGITKSRLVE